MQVSVIVLLSFKIRNIISNRFRKKRHPAFSRSLLFFIRAWASDILNPCEDDVKKS